MSDTTLRKQAATAIRTLVDENTKLAEDSELFKECIKIAFDLAESGNIDDSYESIMGKAAELLEDREEIPVIKKAMEYNTSYNSVGDIEKKASLNTSTAEDKFLTRLLNG